MKKLNLLIALAVDLLGAGEEGFHLALQLDDRFRVGERGDLDEGRFANSEQFGAQAHDAPRYRTRGPGRSGRDARGDGEELREDHRRRAPHLLAVDGEVGHVDFGRPPASRPLPGVTPQTPLPHPPAVRPRYGQTVGFAASETARPTD